MCLYKFTHILLLKNNTLLKQKSDKKTITQIYQEIKIIFRKKITFKQKKKNHKRKQKRKKKRKKKSNWTKPAQKIKRKKKKKQKEEEVRGNV